MPPILLNGVEKMDKRMLNTNYNFTLADGSNVAMTLSFYALYQLRSKNKSLYERYNKIMSSNSRNNFDELDTITLLYTAYVCANMAEENLLSEEDFMILCGSDRKAVGKALEHLINPKKAMVSGNHSS